MKLLKIEKEAKWGGFHHDTDYINIEYIVTINEQRTSGATNRCSKIRVKGAQDTWIQDVRTPEELAKEIEQMLIYNR